MLQFFGSIGVLTRL